MKPRKASISRKTKETAVSVAIAIDGTGKSSIATGIGFLDHMLTLFSKHGLVDVTVKASGDTHVDYHHTVEDVGICLGEAVKKALGSKAGIRRYGYALIPMDESLGCAVLDLSGRGFLVYEVKTRARKIGTLDLQLIQEFFQAFALSSAVTLHLKLHYGTNAHHCMEAVFKAFAKAFEMATRKDSRIKGVPSSKGKL